MTVQEAFAELRVDPAADVESIRRAYLRLIKERRPESDAAGFKRAREAFEVARAAREMEALVAVSAPAGPPTSPSSGDPGEQHQRPPPRTDAFQPYLDAWKAIPLSADMRQRLKIAQQARDALPHDPRAYWLVVSTLDGRALDVDLAEALRAGWRRGWPDFLQGLLVRLPGRAARAEVEAALDSPRIPLRLLGATVAARWDAPRAASVVVEICDQLLATASNEPAREIPVERMLHVVLVLQELAALPEATRAQDTLRRRLQETGLELRLMSGPLGGLWTLAEEIAALPADFPRALRSAFAAAARSGDMRTAFFDACFHVRHHRRETNKWVKRLGPTVPNVAGTLRAAIQRESARKRAWALGQFRWSFLIWPAVMVLSRLLASGSGCSSSDVPAPAPTFAKRPAGTDRRLSMVRDSARGVCGFSGARNGQPVCADIEAVLVLLDGGACSEIPARVRAVKHKLYDRSVTDLDARLMTNLELASWQTCEPRRAQPEPDR